MQGIIIKIVAGVYTVLGEDNNIYICKPRGLFRYHSLTPKTGDNVLFDNETIYEVKERKNDFIRPLIANVDYVILVMSLKKPDFSFELLDRFLINAEGSDVNAIILVTKCDLGNSCELSSIKEKMEYYSKYYKIFYSSIDGIENSEEFVSLLKGKLSVISGQTGSGKSHFLNTLSPGLALKTQEISIAKGRGKHTTRQTEILNINGLEIADTPGFSSFEFMSMDPVDLKDRFPEFREELNKCKFNQCLHLKEPKCRIKEMVENKEILQSRYDSYVKIYNELSEIKKKYKKDK